MKFFPNNLSRKPLTRRMVPHAFTLTEMMTAVAIFSLIVIAMVSLQVFGFKMNTFTSSKLTFTAYSLKALDQIRNQVRAASVVHVGNGNRTSFTLTDTTGNALQIVNLTGCLRFYLDTNTTKLYRLDINGNSTNSSTIASNVVNQTVPIFQMQDYQGNPVTNILHCTVQMTLQFSQTNFTVPSNIVDSYTLQTLMTPRNQY